jgi:hypothetical protein
MSVTKRVVGKMSVDKMFVDKRNVDEMTGRNVCIQDICR